MGTGDRRERRDRREREKEEGGTEETEEETICSSVATSTVNLNTEPGL
jgi:hypothetical protein